MIKTAYLTDTGRKRQLNEDYVYASEKPVGNLPNLFIVADGMGGHKAGDYASEFTVNTMVKEIENSFEKNPSIIFQKAISTANRKLREVAAQDLSKKGMGTTVVAATCMGKYLQGRLPCTGWPAEPSQLRACCLRYRYGLRSSRRSS